MKGVVGWAGISGVLFETATRDLSAINGAFGLTSAEWTVIAFVFAVLAAIAGTLRSTHISTSSSLVET